MANPTLFDPFQTRDTFNTGSGTAGIYRLERLERQGFGAVSKLPFSMRVLLEAVLRNWGYERPRTMARRCWIWQRRPKWKSRLPPRGVAGFHRVPCVVDLAAMRSAMKRSRTEED
jgi:aconitate hydratase